MTASNKVARDHKEYRKLQEQCDEYLGHIQYYSSECVKKDNELRYLYDFLRYKGISDEFDHFRQYAHEVDSPETLPFYTL